MNFENVIFSNLIFNEEYSRKVIPYLKDEYFQETKNKVVFDLINRYFNKYNRCPNLEALSIDLSNHVNLNEQSFDECKEVVASLENNNTDLEWLTTETEKFCQEKAIYNALCKSISIIDDKNSTLDKGAIPHILTQALGVNFDQHIGHDYIEDSDSRYEYYHRKEERIPFDIDLLNKITAGGLPKKTLNIILGGTGVGKTIVMCHMAAYNLMCSKNVLYITAEMAEEEISRRIDSNLLDIPIEEMETIPKDLFDKKINRLKTKTTGKLRVKEYPTSAANANHFRHLLNELRIKENFVPDVIYVDYINICSSFRLKLSSSVNSYTLIKTIAEELRGLAVEYNLPLVSATQTNRDGYSSSDLTLGDTSESFGLPMTADFMIGISVTEELAKLNQILIKQLGKNRYFDSNKLVRFIVGLDRLKMRLYNVEDSAQDIIGGPNEDKPIFESTKFGKEEVERSEKFFSKDMFKEFT